MHIVMMVLWLLTVAKFVLVAFILVNDMCTKIPFRLWLLFSQDSTANETWWGNKAMEIYGERTDQFILIGNAGLVYLSKHPHAREGQGVRADAG